MELNMTHRTSTKRLEVIMSWWGMTGLQMCEELGTEDKVRLIAEAGYDGINGFLPKEKEAENWHRLLEKYNLTFSVNAYPKSAQELEIFLEDAKAFGKVDFVNVQVMRPFLTGKKAIHLLSDLEKVSQSVGIPAYIETHRGTITQDLIRTVEYVQSLQDPKLTIDLSHYILAGEMLTIQDEAEQMIQTLLSKTKSIHARVSNGQQIQVAIPEPRKIDLHQMNCPLLDQFQDWWLMGMRNWMESASDKEDMFPFICELGPPPYAMTLSNAKKSNIETSDRWSQGLLFAEIARSLWKQV
ncbi:sugar phosphate isomerase/epimerase family protein [Alkalicoccobacillus murimartini]|uniref:Sugar phosphate isomerase/epimerase n=1 Tax=Alkalicoccobacillus murimartini TaxID=171685 RepID=A0ABT9YJY0_9BACI|nr:sugar phosphate isomerase/epimerase [Alkalicoccobacillus murimartini]MDQ0207522.1 sugar phosphate isomerase/epimerase [Alkalicoccobacillus murimartini]